MFLGETKLKAKLVHKKKRMGGWEHLINLIDWIIDTLVPEISEMRKERERSSGRKALVADDANLTMTCYDSCQSTS